jgi:hypothetical protein
MRAATSNARKRQQERLAMSVLLAAVNGEIGSGVLCRFGHPRFLPQ